MKTDLDHLPESRRREVSHVRDIILDANSARIEQAKSKREKGMRILKIILFGSFAKGTWFVDRSSGRASDYDLLVIVSHKDFSQKTGFWDEVENRLLDDSAVRKEVSLIVHTLNDVNAQLKDGQYFFSEIVNQGVLLYDSGEKKENGAPVYKLAEPGKPDPRRAYEMASGYYAKYRRDAEEFLAGYDFHLRRDALNIAAFNLHQAAENSYRMFLLTMTLYAPATHSLKTLRGVAENIDDRLKPAWPRDRRPYKRYFELVRRAYTEARYSLSYETTTEALEWQENCISTLLELAVVSCEERLHVYRIHAGLKETRGP